MKAVVTYESLYGNTAEVARAVGEGLAAAGTVVVMPASDDVLRELEGADLLVVGGPTHVHGMSTDTSRRAAVDAASKQGDEIHIEGESIRKLLDGIGEGGNRLAAAFDTRGHGPRVLTGSASKSIARRLRRHGFELLCEPESFVVTASEGPLAEGELERAGAWGVALAEAFSTHPVSATS